MGLAETCSDGASEPEAFRRIIQGDTNAAHARHGIGLRRNFANLALDLIGRKQLQADGERQADGQGQGEVRADIDHSLANVRSRHGHDALTRRDDLSHLGAYGRDDTRETSFDLGITQLLDCFRKVRSGASGRCLRARANLTKAIEQLGYAQVRADFAGVVTAVSADVGQVVQPGQSVVTIARPDVREAVVDIGADFSVPLTVGLPFTVSLQPLPTVQVQGQIREIAPQADSVTRMRRVRIALNDPPESFRLGSTVTARPNNGHNQILRVPASAVLRKSAETFVWVVDDPASTVSLHKVDLSEDEVGIRVNSGLTAGTRIVTAGIHSLEQGQQVRIQEESTP